MKKLSIDQIVYLWRVKYKYDHVLHGFTFEEDSEMSPDKIKETMDNLKSKYGD